LDRRDACHTKYRPGLDLKAGRRIPKDGRNALVRAALLCQIGHRQAAVREFRREGEHLYTEVPLRQDRISPNMA
jgi:hypothetical protein